MQRTLTNYVYIDINNSINLATEMELEIPLEWIPTLLKKEILSTLLKHKRISPRIPLLSLMIIRIVSIIIPSAQF
jgi:hypothetical protein